MSSQRSTSSPTRIRRARSLLGTVVEISATAIERTETHAAIDHAFDAIERVDRLMSFHSENSDLTRLNTRAHISAQEVDPWTYQVLEIAKRLFNDTRGIFDCTAAEQLMQWQLLPEKRGVDAAAAASFNDVKLLPHNTVQFRIPLALDLGGIAKGYAVDKGVEALQSSGISQGMINAGGDVRIFGAESEQIFLRNPKQPETLLGPISITNAAIATSSPHVSLTARNGTIFSALVHGQTRRPFTQLVSLSIQAPTCVVADGLTKLISALEFEWGDALARYAATAYLVSDGEILCLEHE